MFAYESIVIGPAELPSRWKTRAQELESKRFGWQSRADGRRLWEAVRAEVALVIESELGSVRW